MNLPKLQASPVSATTYKTQNGTTGTGPISLAAEFHRRNQYRAAAVEDMAHKAVRMDAKTFRDKFFPLPAVVSPDDRPEWDRNLFKGLAKVEATDPEMLEAKTAEEFIKAIKSVANLTPKLRLAESQHRPDQGDRSKLRVDAGFFRQNFVPTDKRPHWADQIVPVEFKSHDTKNDPYDDRPKKFVEAEALTRKEVRGQLIDYAEHIFRYQHRTELYMLLILGRRFRFLRWDRSGTIVTPAADYCQDPDMLCEMLWRMSLLNDEQLGLDPAAERLLPNMDQYKDMDAAAVPRSSDIDHTPRSLAPNEDIPKNFVFRYVREAFANSLDPKWPRYCLSVPNGTGVRKFLVGKPNFHASGMAGRGTRGYVALDCETLRFVWLKDAWRAYYDLVQQEGAVLAELNKAGVPNVPTLVCHGDILEQKSRTPEFWKPPVKPANTTSASAPPSSAPANRSSSRTLAEVQQPEVKKLLKRRRSEVDTSDTAIFDSDATLSDDDDDASPDVDNTSPDTDAASSNSDAASPDTAAALAEDEVHENCPLRRHMHYRVVVKEVCMPLVKFTSGRQLLEIARSCVIAHRDAMRIAKIVHRDVSGGNMLILPRTFYHPASKRKVIQWLGVLADWELSKPVDDKSPPRARQPERTGTWQYMSVATLNEHAKVVETSDELESFFHVILYYAVRYLVSNCSDAGNFIENFFESYSLVNKKYLCGKTKRSAMYSGKLVLDDTDSSLKFSSPLDWFLLRLLALFKAHYAVVQHKKKQAEKANAVEPAPFATDEPLDVPVMFEEEFEPLHPLEESSAQEHEDSLADYIEPLADDDEPLADDDEPLADDDEPLADDDEPLAYDDELLADDDEPPDAAQVALSLQVQSHDCLVEALTHAVVLRGWNRGDRVRGDNVSPFYTPQNAVGPKVSSAKRIRTGTAAGSSFVVALTSPGSFSALDSST
ncbi:uncharacterized protein TRAVEDRAFT_75206 [Trametes versicolor FP-101664 SS1]|uniref:uncharacterized protein n=1 Tax=Trametes versicolor (strain FP-101664) TaxID=717944 RepID=UPI0004622CC2|nr:uncharacterized protein TRAVEDRAFT_75206 [Trametes versicolor FP-101664 SS1]EIW53024.1 hypothetical protein TRAVEDRAFT_75206 [Trametes versicolor FP-101664 SS1]